MGMQCLSVGVRSWEGLHECQACNSPWASLPWQVRKTSAPSPSVTDAALVFPLPSSQWWLEIPLLREGWHSRVGKWPRLMKNKASSEGRYFTVARMLLLCQCNAGLCKCWIGQEPKTLETKHGRWTWILNCLRSVVNTGPFSHSHKCSKSLSRNTKHDVWQTTFFYVGSCIGWFSSKHTHRPKEKLVKQHLFPVWCTL